MRPGSPLVRTAAGVAVAVVALAACRAEPSGPRVDPMNVDAPADEAVRAAQDLAAAALGRL
jgi:hypothetical protein